MDLKETYPAGGQLANKAIVWRWRVAGGKLPPDDSPLVAGNFFFGCERPEVLVLESK